MKRFVEAYAQDQLLFFDNYAKAHVKISELGHEEYLLSEVGQENVVDGSYIEPFYIPNQELEEPEPYDY